MQLLELFNQIKEEKLSKDQLESYHSQLSHMFADMKIEYADLEKEEAMFFYERTSKEVTDISIKRIWKASKSGQRMILLKAYIGATTTILQSLKSRLYTIY